MIITLLQGLILLSYISFLLIKFNGPLPSISESWYRLKDLGGVWYSLFTFFCFSIGFLMFFQTNESTGLFFLSGISLAFVGAATAFKQIKTLTPYIHFIGAFLGISGALIGIAIERNCWIPIILFVLISLLIKLFNIKNNIWWIEIAAFFTILGGLLF